MKLSKRKGLLVLCVLGALLLSTPPHVEAQESSAEHSVHRPMVAAQAELPPRLEVRPIQLLSGNFSTTAISGTLVFAGGKNELTVLDVSDPSEPAVRGKHALPCLPDDIVVDGVFVVVACPGTIQDNVLAGLYIFELQHGATLVQRAHYLPRDSILTFDVSGGLVFVGMRDGVLIYDVPSLTLRGTYAISGWDRVQDIAVVDRRAYMVDGYSLTILDISDPAAPRLIGQPLLLDGANYVAAIGDFVYVVTNVRSRASPDPFGTIHVIGVHDPVRPVVRGRLGGFGYGLYGIEVAGDHVVVYGEPFWYDGPNDVLIVDVADPDAPRTVGLYTTLSDEKDVAFQQIGVVVVATDGGLHILDGTTNPPAQRSVYRPFGKVTDVQVVGTTAYVLSEFENGKGLAVVDVRNALMPRVRGFIDLPSMPADIQPSGLAVQGDYVYVPTSERLYIVKISAPEHLSIVGRLEGAFPRIAVAESYAYVLYVGGFRVIDITDPTTPQVVGTFRLAGSVDITVVETTVYVLTSTALVIVDATAPGSLAELGRYSVTADRLEVVDDLAYVSGTAFQSVDVSDPEHPMLHQTYAEWGSDILTHALQVSGDQAYVEVFYIDRVGIPQTSLHVLEFRAQGTSLQRGVYDVFRSPGGFDVAGDQLFFTDGDFRIATLAEMDNAVHLPLIFQELR